MSDSDNLANNSDQPTAKKVKFLIETQSSDSSQDTRQSSKWSQNIIVETGRNQDQLNTRHTVNVIVNDKKKKRQRRYRELHRNELKQREAERRHKKKLEIIPEASTSSNIPYIEIIDEELATVTCQRSYDLEGTQKLFVRQNEKAEEKSALQKKRERQQRYRETHRKELSQREMKRQHQKNSEIITQLSIYNEAVINDETITNSVAQTGLQETQDLIVQMKERSQQAKSSTERSRAYRERQKMQNKKQKKAPKSDVERNRAYRERMKQRTASQPLSTSSLETADTREAFCAESNIAPLTLDVKVVQIEAAVHGNVTALTPGEWCAIQLQEQTSHRLDNVDSSRNNLPHQVIKLEENESDSRHTIYSNSEHLETADYETTEYDTSDYKTTDYDTVDYNTADYETTDVAITSEQEPSNITPVTKKRKLHTRDEITYDKMESEFLLRPQSVSTTTTERSECAIYGELVAKRLENMEPSERDYVMHEIDNIMYQAKMRLCQNRYLNPYTSAHRKPKTPQMPSTSVSVPRISSIHYSDPSSAETHTEDHNGEEFYENV